MFGLLVTLEYYSTTNNLCFDVAQNIWDISFVSFSIVTFVGTFLYNSNLISSLGGQLGDGDSCRKRPSWKAARLEVVVSEMRKSIDKLHQVVINADQWQA
jgi:hypothetical protein